MKTQAFTAFRFGVAGVAFGVLGLACSSTHSGNNSTTGTGGVTGVGTGDGGAAAGIGGTTVSGGTGGTDSPGSAGTTGALGGAPGLGGSPAGGTGGSSIVDASAPDVPPTPAFTGTYHMGADITWVQHDEFFGATYVDTDGVQKDILALLKNHGFNSVRLRTFVDPTAADGYDQAYAFGDLAHTVTMGQRIKQAGMGFLLAVHYSDNWADPGKQCIPVAWQQDTFAQLTQHVHDYTLNLITSLKNAGAQPDLVQIGNEITPGMLFSICDSTGTPTSTTPPPVNGSAGNWTNLGALLKAGIQAVKQVDPRIKTVLHIDKGGDLGASVDWINHAVAALAPTTFDVFADTSYVRWQGQPSQWQNTFGHLATMFPNLQFIIPEYGNETATSPATPSTMRIANDTIFNISGNRGVGTWIYEPEHPSQAGIGIGLFVTTPVDGGIQDSWPAFPALSGAMAIYDQMKIAYGSRL